jgi:hypothetical protein
MFASHLWLIESWRLQMASAYGFENLSIGACAVLPYVLHLYI